MPREPKTSGHTIPSHWIRPEGLDLRAIIRDSEQSLRVIAAIRAQQQAISGLPNIPPARKKALAESARTPHPEVSNFVELADLYRHEAACLLDAFQQASGLERSLYARLLALSMFESFNTLRALAGRTFREEMVAKLGKDADHEAKALNKTIDTIFERVRKDFKELRHELAGHKSRDAAVRFRLLTQVDEAAVKSAAVHALLTLSDIHGLTTRYLQECLSRLQALTAQLYSSSLPGSRE